MNLKHEIAPVPHPLWGKNMRKVMTQTEWKKLRISLIEERGMVCETCGKHLSESKQIKAHEDWHYDLSQKPAVAYLTKITLSCFHCHAIEHFSGLDSMVFGGELSNQAIIDTIQHFCVLNSATEQEFELHRKEAIQKWSEMNKLEWVINWGVFSDWVKENFEGDPLTSPRKLKSKIYEK